MNINLQVKEKFSCKTCVSKYQLSAMQRQIKIKKKPPRRQLLFLLLHLFNDGKNKSHKGFGKAYGFFFNNKSGKTFAISHIFVFCPAGSNRMTAFKLAAIIIKRNVREHKIKILSLLIRRKAFPCCQLFY